MNTSVLNSETYLKMVLGATSCLNANRKIVNDLNVFPIPDGDTGDNMFMTIDSGAVQGKSADDDKLCHMASAVSKGMLMGARGNSGVILSRIFAGIAKGLEGLQTADLKDFSKAMNSGVRESYNAVSIPVEGTILTVFKDSVRYANGCLNESSTFESYFEDLHKELLLSLDRTPDLLPVLKESGVVDSGGAGLDFIVRGMSAALKGESFENASDSSGQKPQLDLSLFTEDSELEFGYCTEFLLRLQTSKLDLAAFDESVIRDYLNSVGDSVVCFREGSIVKAHVHTKTPGDILNHCQKYGEYLTLKIENMTLQHQETTIQNHYEKPRKRVGVVTVASGEGLVNIFCEAGADEVIEGGQTMNPSVESFVNAFDKVNADVIFVFPNNSNIIMTARQAADVYNSSKIRVIPTKTIGEGYVGIASLDTSEKDIDALETSANQIISTVITGMVSKAIRDTFKDGVAINEGDYIGFSAGEILVDSSDLNEAAVALSGKLQTAYHDVCLVFRGADVTEDEAESYLDSLRTYYPRTEFIFSYGGQPVFDYIIVLC